MKFTFDGHGINDAENEYKPRVATLSPLYKTASIGRVLAAAPDMLQALEMLTDDLSGEPYEVRTASMVKANAAIAKATGG